MNPQPPKRALKFLRWFCREDYLEEFEGDLVELFEKHLEQSPRKARRKFFWGVLRCFRPGFTKAFYKVNHSNTAAMLRNYFKISWRNLLKEKLDSVIAIGGLAIGIACFVAIFLYVNHELSYDRHFENSDQIYRVYSHERSGETYLGSDKYATIPIPLADAIRDEFPEVLSLTSFEPQSALLRNEDYSYDEDGLWVDENFLDVFSFKFVQGNPETALSQAESIVLTVSLANKLFGSVNPVGKELSWQIRDDKKVFVVTGVISDPPEETSFKFSFLAPHRARLPYQNAWDTSNSHTFMILAEGTNPRLLEEKMPALLEKYQEESLWVDFHQEEYLFQSLSAYHLENMVIDDVGLKGNPQQVRIFSIVGVLILLLACINYMNLAIAKSVNRASEVGVRKVIGASKGQLIIQFLSESILLASIALVCALIILTFLLPEFSGWVERPLQLTATDTPLLFPGLLLIVLSIGLISGSYPAFLMSSLQPVKTLKKRLKLSTKGFNLQRTLIISQYVVSIIMIIGSLVIYRQYNFIRHSDLGYQREHIVSVRIQDFPSDEEYQVMKNEWLTNPNVLSVTASTHLPINIESNTVINYEEENTDNPLVMYRNKIDPDFLNVYGIELVTGSGFYEEANTTSNQLLLLNESACKALKWQPEEAIGQQIKHRGKVVGVVKDFHLFSLHHPIQPLMLQLNNSARFEYVSVKIRPGDFSATIELLEETVSRYSDYPFEYKFLDDEFDQLYKSDTRMGEMLASFTLVSLLIATMGLFGLTAFTTNQRTKEIGIRKVLGAHFHQLIQLLSKELLTMILVSFLIAIPIAWYLTKSWLLDYAYRIEMQWWMFALPGLAVMTLAFLTIGQQTFKVAQVNPVECLKDE